MYLRMARRMTLVAGGSPGGADDSRERHVQAAVLRRVPASARRGRAPTRVRADPLRRRATWFCVAALALAGTTRPGASGPRVRPPAAGPAGVGGRLRQG